AAMVGSLFMITLSHAADTDADTDKVDTPKANMEQKQSAKEKEKKTKRGDTGSMGEERTGGSGPSGTSGGENVKAPQHEGAGSKKKP
ncbi:MAG TPA: hypothetical protein VFB56_08405, partial [Nitrospiraceae bacterium]|nr:hypothetical protein [Nitrospiraceae bacterium]